MIHNKKNSTGNFEPTLSCADFYELLGIGEETYCRSVCHAMKNWEFIGNRKSGKPTTSLNSFVSESETHISPGIEEAVDVFFSPNEFFDWRNTKQLSQLRANWIEIDTLKHEVISIEEQSSIYRELLYIIQDSNIPQPTCFVASGSGGIHIYWVYEGVEAYKWRVDIWRKLTKVIAKKIERKRNGHSKWHIDYQATNDPARVMRLPGSYHSKSGRFVTPYLGGTKYNFDDLVRNFGLDPEKKTFIKKSFKNNDNKKQPNHEAPKGKHSIKDWWFRIYTEVCTHGRTQGVKEGHRDLFAFILFVALRHIKKTPESALEAVERLNIEFIGLEQDELHAYLKTATTTFYKYRKENLAVYLRNIGVSVEFLFDKEKNHPNLSEDEIKSRQKKAAQTTAVQRKHKTLATIIKAIKSLVKTQKKVTQINVACVAGVCVRTVKRYWAERELVDFRTMKNWGN